MSVPEPVVLIQIGPPSQQYSHVLLHLHVLLPCKDLSRFLKNEDLTLNEANEALPNSSGVPPGLQAKALGSQLCSNDGILEIRLWEKNRI